MRRPDMKDITFRTQYSLQQLALSSICEDLGLRIFYPDYHQKKGDANTMLLYFEEDYNFNADLDQQEKKLGYVPGEYRQAVISRRRSLVTFQESTGRLSASSRTLM